MTSKTVTLSQPVQRGETAIATIDVQKPSTGSLRGLALTDVLRMDVNAMLKLLPRITQPALLPDEVAALDPADLTALAGTVVSFFVSAEQLKALENQA